MESAKFWDLIDRARNGKTRASEPSATPDSLRRTLDRLTTEEVTEFGKEFYRQIIALNDWRLWGAGYVITGGMGDDSFHYFRSWLVGKGKEAVDVARSNPDLLGPFIDDEDVENEELEYVALDVLEARKIEGDFRDDFEEDADDEPTGNPFDEETVEMGYPKLAAQFG